jgi:hypothetical protein
LVGNSFFRFAAFGMNLKRSLSLFAAKPPILLDLAAQPAVVGQHTAAWTRWNQQNIPPLWGLPPGVSR